MPNPYKDVYAYSSFTAAGRRGIKGGPESTQSDGSPQFRMWTEVNG